MKQNETSTPSDVGNQASLLTILGPLLNHSRFLSQVAVITLEWPPLQSSFRMR